MAFRLRMPAEIGEWLTGLAGAQPEAAAEVVAALLALTRADSIPGPPLVTGDSRPPRGLYPDPDTAADPREALDLLYHHLLEGLQKTRREVADAATSRRRLELQLAAEPGQDLRGSLERQLAAARELESVSARLAQRLQAMVDRFRTRRETASAVATATVASQIIRRSGEHLLLPPLDAAAAERASRESDARIQHLLAEGRRLLAVVRAGFPTADEPATSQPEGDVLTLRADPLGSGALIFFAEEPVGMLTLLTALDDRHAVDEHHDAAVDLAGRLLEEIRDDGWSAESLDFDDPDALVARFLPGRGPDLAARAAARTATVMLTALRDQKGLSMARVAELAGLSEGQVKLMELRGPGSVELLAAYARALGGTLRLTIELDGTAHSIG